MILAVKAEGKDLLSLMDDPEMTGYGTITEENMDVINGWANCYSLVDAYGFVHAVTGFMDDGEAFLFFRKKSEKFKLSLVKIIKEYLRLAPFPVYAKIDVGYTRGIRFATVLGFKVRAPGIAQPREGQKDFVYYDYIKGV